MKVFSIASFGAAACILLCCGDVGFNQKFRIDVEAVAESPDDASGNASPLFATMTVESATLVGEDGDTMTMLATKKELVVINRPQKIVETDIEKDMNGKTYTSLVVTVSPKVIAESRFAVRTLTLPQTELNYTTPLTISKGRDVEFALQLLWQNTVTRDESQDPVSDTISAPSLKIVLNKK